MRSTLKLNVLISHIHLAIHTYTYIYIHSLTYKEKRHTQLFLFFFFTFVTSCLFHCVEFTKKTIGQLSLKHPLNVTNVILGKCICLQEHLYLFSNCENYNKDLACQSCTVYTQGKPLFSGNIINTVVVAIDYQQVPISSLLQRSGGISVRAEKANFEFRSSTQIRHAISLHEVQKARNSTFYYQSF